MLCQLGKIGSAQPRVSARRLRPPRLLRRASIRWWCHSCRHHRLAFVSAEWLGLYQVHGNAWQWVEDCWHENYQGAPVDGSAWVSGACTDRVLRGGAWNSGPDSLRAASRRILERDDSSSNRHLALIYCWGMIF